MDLSSAQTFWMWFLIFLVPIALLYLYQNIRAQSTKGPIIEVNEEGVLCRYPTRNIIDSINWKDIDRIDVDTTNEGPYSTDVYIVLINLKSNTGVNLPQDAAATKTVIDKIMKFPNFDYKTFAFAMGSHEYRNFKIWEKDPA